MLDYDKKFLIKSLGQPEFDGSSIRDSRRNARVTSAGDGLGLIYWAPADVFGSGKVLIFGHVIDKDGSPSRPTYAES